MRPQLLPDRLEWLAVEVPAGTRIADRYVVLGDVGAGGMGVVVRAKDERLGRLVAVKLLAKDALGDEASRKRLIREARAVASLDHPNIVHVYDAGETKDQSAFLVMELVKGRSLGDHLRDGSLSRSQRLAACVSVARALQYAHEQGFLHRDIKPDNVMVRDDGRVVVLDFGLAKSVAPGLGTTVEASLVSTKSSFVGTPAYVSPEQARGDELDDKSDQFSLAVSMFEMLTGELPWDGGTPLEVISHILRGEPKKLRAAWPDASEDLEKVLDRALAKDRADRHPSCGAFADALEGAWPEIARAPSLREIGTGPSQSSTSASLRTLSAPATSKTQVGHGGARPWYMRWAAALAMIGVVGAGATTKLVLEKDKKVASVPAALGEHAIIACPILVTTDPDLGKDTTWLGAAASTLVCHRVQTALGGDPSRTRAPAELLALPREPREGFPDTPFEKTEAIDETLAEAKHADAWIDGSLDHSGDFHVMLTLHAKNGDALAHGDGRAPTLTEALRAAMPEIIAKLEPAADEAYAQKWFAGTTANGRVTALDLHAFVLMEDHEGERPICAALSKADLGTLYPIIAATCAKEMFEPTPPLPAFDASTPGMALTTASALRFGAKTTDADKTAQRDRATKLEELAKTEMDLGAKGLLLAAAAEILYAVGDNKASSDDARAAIQASPKIADIRGNAWHRQSFVTTADSKPVLAAHAAWLPWEPYAWPNLTITKHGLHDTEGAKRAALLAERGYWVVDYGVRLTETDQLVAVRGVVAKAHDDRLDVLVLHGEHKPGAALDMAIEKLKTLSPSPKLGNTPTRIAADVVSLGAFLGRNVDGPIEDYLNRFVFIDPPALTHGVTTLFATIATCTQARHAVGDKCVERLADLYAKGWFGGAVLNSGEAIEGARRYVRGDFAGAAKSWRPNASDFLAESMREPMTVAFERAGDDDLAEQLDNRAIELNTISPVTDSCWVRAAMRAEKRGDLPRAQKLAQAFVDRWKNADERPPTLADMKRVLTKTK